MSDRSRQILQRLFVIQLLAMLAMEMSGPFWPLYLQTMPGSDGLKQIAGIGAYVAPMLGVMLTSTLWGRLGDRYGHRLMMMRALTGLALTQGLLAWASTPEQVLLLRFMQGLLAGFIAPAMAYGAGFTEPEKRGRLFAWLQSATNLGSLAGPVVGGLIMDFSAFSWINLTASALCLGLLIAMIRLLPDNPSCKETPAESAPTSASAPARASISVSSSPAPNALPNALPAPSISPSPHPSISPAPLIISLMLLTACLLLSRMISVMPFSLYMTEVLSVSGWQAGFCYGMQALGFLLTARFWAGYTEHLQPAQLMLRITGIVSACALLAFGLSMITDYRLFALGYLLWGMLLAGTTPVLTGVVSAMTSSQHQGHLLGKQSALNQLASIIGLSIGGWLDYRYGPAGIFTAVALAYLGGLSLSLYPLYLACQQRADAESRSDASPVSDDGSVSASDDCSISTTDHSGRSS